MGTVGRADDGGLEAGVEAEVVKEVMPSSGNKVFVL